VWSVITGRCGGSSPVGVVGLHRPVRTPRPDASGITFSLTPSAVQTKHDRPCRLGAGNRSGWERATAQARSGRPLRLGAGNRSG
jgi:hypothetical protein